MSSQIPDNTSILLRGKRAIVAVSGAATGSAISRGLVRCGASVTLLADDPSSASGAGVAVIASDFSSRQSLDDAFEAATRQAGPADVVIHSALPAAALEQSGIEALDAKQWQAACIATMKSTLFVLQAAHRHFAGRGGSIVLIGPALSLVGAAGLVPLSTAVEGQRSLMKSAARQWGQLGITLNWIAVGSAMISPALAAAEPRIPELGPPPPALGRAPDLENGIAPVVAFLASPAGRVASGVTMNLDGGNWMIP